MKKNPSSQAQTTISSYFTSTSSGHSSKAAEKRRASDIVDLTVDDISDDEPTAKKLRSFSITPSNEEHGAVYFKPDLSNPLHEGIILDNEGPSRMKTPPPRSKGDDGSPVSKYRFLASPNNYALNNDVSQTPEERRAKRARREIFKRKLLAGNSTFSQQTAKASNKAQKGAVDTTYLKEPEIESELEGDDVEKNALPDSVTSKKFNSTTTGRSSKSDTIGSKKREKEEIGPSGLPYTPLEQQIRKLKKKYPNTLLMVEVGYKYRFFGEDAKIASRHLSIVAFNDRNFLVAGIPVHRRDIHLKKLLSQGYKVGIVGQMETAALKKVSDNRNAPFERDLTHLYTAATYIEELDSVDDASQVNPGLAPNLLCVVEGLLGGMGADERVAFGIVAVTPSTGDVIWDDFEDGFMRTELETRMTHIRPAELLLPKDKLTNASEKLLHYFTDDHPGNSVDKERVRVERLSKSISFSVAFQELQDFYTQEVTNRASENFISGKLLASLSNLPQRVIIGLAQSLRYLKTFGLAEVLIRTEFFTKFTERQHMLLNANTLANLEIYRNQTDYTAKGSLLWTCDKTKTKFGARLFRHWLGRPLIDIRALQTRVDAIDEILNASSVRLREYTIRLAEILKGLPDLAKGLSRVQYGKCPPREFAHLVKSFNKIAAAFEVYQSPRDVGFRSESLNDIIYALPKLKKPIRKILSEFNLAKAVEDKRDELWYDVEKYPNVEDARSAIAMIESELQDHLKQVRKILHKPNAQYTNVAGEEYLIEIKKDEKREIPVTWKIVSSTKFLRRYQTPEAQKKLQERAQYQEVLEAEANKAYLDYLKQVMDEHYVPFRNVVNKLAIADCLLSLSTVAAQADYVKPSFVDDDVLDIKDGRHPMIEALRTDPFVPNDLCLGDGCTRTKIITGPNMGGKSSAVRMVALVALMAQIGSYVPASSVRMGLLDAILTRMGASDDITSGRSTFMIEMSETSDILHTATNKSLVILDELGRGTSTFDGMAIAGGVLDYLVSEKRCKTLFITHYPLVATTLVKKYPADVSNVHMGFSEVTGLNGKRSITFLYRIAEGLSSGSYGIECARLAGLPEELLETAACKANSMQDVVEGRERIRRSRKVWQTIGRLIRHDDTTDINDLIAKLHYILK